MKLKMISFTMAGGKLCKKLCCELLEQGHEVLAYSVEKYADASGVLPLLEPLTMWTQHSFLEEEGIIFIGACGIAVRSIAPYIQDKTKDPAVIVVDEAGDYVISLLSGHLGGANELAATIAAITKGQPVITTASDVNQTFAVDVFAKKNCLHISSMGLAKEISSAVLAGQSIGLVSDLKIVGDLPSCIIEDSEAAMGIYIGLYEHLQPFPKTLHLVPRIVSVGIGCRKDASKKQIMEAVQFILGIQKLSIHCIEQIASIHLKKKEAGILEAADTLGIPFCTFGTGELQSARGNYTESIFVEQITGVDNVCERSAVMASMQGTLIQRKTAKNGVTTALAVRDWSVSFE